MYKNIFRSIHTGIPRLLRGAGRRANPGNRHQLRTLEPEEAIEHDFADVESDFMDVHKSHKQYEVERQRYQEQTRHWVVKQKYFKEKLPNFLTYAEKEQIRLLHNRDPDEWNKEKLAESFPATPEIVNKILRADWKPSSVKRLRQHDELVIKNWEIFRSGGYPQLQSAFKEHLLKFANRTNSDLMNIEREWQPRPELPKPKGTEFSSIISSCHKYNEQHHEPETSLLEEKKYKTKGMKTKNPNDDDTYLLQKVYDKRPMRIQELKQLKNINPFHSSANTDVRSDISLEQRAVEAFGNSSGTGVLPKDLESSSDANNSSYLIEKFQSKEIVVSQEDQKSFEMTTVKDRIYIPRKLRSKGATYKVEDCYYDDDGEFLYRVPGMSGRQS